jgi:hypothetical protein
MRKLLYCIFVLVFASVSYGQIGDRYVSKPPLGTPINYWHPQLNGCIGWWLFQEGAGGTVRNVMNPTGDIDGVLTDMANPSTAISGWGTDGVLVFDGVDDQLVVSDHPSLKNLTEGTFTCWFRLRTGWAAGGDPAKVIAQKNEAGGNSGDWYIVFIDDGKLYFALQTIVTTRQVLSDSAVWDAGVWYHVAAVWHSNLVIMYINGHLQADSGVGENDGMNRDVDLLFGTDAAWPLDGEMKDIRLYGRMLNEAEINSLIHDPFAPFELNLIGVLLEGLFGGSIIHTIID